MQAMHEGGYVGIAEQLLSALVLREGDHGIRWLASQVSQAEEMSGAHSGWWRVLFAGIENIVDGPSLLAACVRNLGPYTLPRYPEVREGFARILNGPKGKSFREALRANLGSLDPSTRRGAAMILVFFRPAQRGRSTFCGNTLTGDMSYLRLA